MPKQMRPLGWIQCPECRENGEPESVVMFQIEDGVIQTLECRTCGLQDSPGVFWDE